MDIDLYARVNRGVTFLFEQKYDSELFVITARVCFVTFEDVFSSFLFS